MYADPTQLPQGFVRRSPRVLVRRSKSPDNQTTNDADIIIIFAWGDAVPKHVAKYSEGFKQLFPGSYHILVFSPIAQTVFTDLQTRMQEMWDVVEALIEAEAELGIKQSKILVHAMSNTGGISLAAFLNAYREAYGIALPHRLLVLDSTPGSPYLTASNLFKWSGAMTLNTAEWFPWPAPVTQLLWAARLCANSLYGWLKKQPTAAVFSNTAIVNETLSTTQAMRLCLYSKSDRLIGWQDIEENAARACKAGYIVELHQFEGSGHVAHMREQPELYWSAISEAWQRAVRS